VVVDGQEKRCRKKKPPKKRKAEPKFETAQKALSGNYKHYKDKCIDPDNIVIYLASDIPPAHSVPLFSPIFNVSHAPGGSHPKVVTLFDFVPSLINSDAPEPLYERALSISPLLHPFNSLILSAAPPPPPETPICFPSENFYCKKRMPFEKYFSSFLPIIDILGSSRGEFFIGTPGSTASANALEMHFFDDTSDINSSSPVPSHLSPPPPPPPSSSSSCFSSPGHCAIPSFSFRDYFDLTFAPSRRGNLSLPRSFTWSGKKRV